IVSGVLLLTLYLLTHLQSAKQTTNASPRGLAQARHVTAHGRFAQLAAGQTELRIYRARTTGQRAAGTQARRAGITRQLLQLGRGGHFLVVARIGVGDDLLQIDALAAVLLDQLGTLQVAIHHGFLGHRSTSLSIAEREVERFE